MKQDTNRRKILTGNVTGGLTYLGPAEKVKIMTMSKTSPDQP